MLKIGDYIIAIKTIRGKSKKDCRYKILDIIEKGERYIEWLDIKYYEYNDIYLIIHNGRLTYSDVTYFKYDYKYNRKLKLKKIKYEQLEKY